MGYEREEAGRRPRFLTRAAGWVAMPFARRENRKTSRFGWGAGVRGTGWGTLGLKQEEKAVLPPGGADSESPVEQHPLPSSSLSEGPESGQGEGGGVSKGK